MTTNSIYDEYSKIVSVAKKISGDKFDGLLKVFERSVSKVVSFNSRVGTVAHICVYLRSIRFLKKIVDKFDDQKRLVEWLSEKDENGLTAINLVEKFEFQEMYIYMNKIVTESCGRNETCILKKGMLNKYVNIVNGYNERCVILTLNSLFYGKKMVLETMTELKLDEVCFEHHPNMRKFKLISKLDNAAYVFKGFSNEDVSDWIFLFQNVIASYDKEFYMHNFVFKAISDVARNTDDRFYKLLKIANIFPFYTKDNRLYMESDMTGNFSTLQSQDSSVMNGEYSGTGSMVEKKAEAQPVEKNEEESPKRENAGARVKAKYRDSHNDLELFSLNSEDDTDYEFFEARDQQS